MDARKNEKRKKAVEARRKTVTTQNGRNSQAEYERGAEIKAIIGFFKSFFVYINVFTHYKAPNDTIKDWFGNCDEEKFWSTRRNDDGRIETCLTVIVYPDADATYTWKPSQNTAEVFVVTRKDIANVHDFIGKNETRQTFVVCGRVVYVFNVYYDHHKKCKIVMYDSVSHMPIDQMDVHSDDRVIIAETLWSEPAKIEKVAAAEAPTQMKKVVVPVTAEINDVTPMVNPWKKSVSVSDEPLSDDGDETNESSPTPTKQVEPNASMRLTPSAPPMPTSAPVVEPQFFRYGCPFGVDQYGFWWCWTGEFWSPVY